MALIVWNQEMSVGVESIDNQHKKLISLLNDLHSAAIEGRDLEKVGETLDQLIQYTIEHFQHEEKLFLQTKYADTQAHIAEHQRLTQKVMLIYSKYRLDPTDALSEETLQLLVKWIMDHTLGSDQRYSAHFIASGVQ